MSGETKSSWRSTWLERAPLATNLDAEVCVVGAGIAGLTTAYLLARAGRKAVVLDDGPIGGGETQRTTAHLSNALDDRYFELERRARPRRVRQLAAASHSAAIDRIESIVPRRAHRPASSSASTAISSRRRESHRDLIARELPAAQRAGLKSVERLPRVPQLPFDTGPCLRFRARRQFHPLALPGRPRARGLRAPRRRDLHRHARRQHGGRRASAGGAPSAGFVVTADAQSSSRPTSPVNERVAMHTKQTAYRTYVIGVDGAARVDPQGALLGHAGSLSLRPPQPRTAATRPRGLLIVGGEDHKTGPGRGPRRAACAARGPGRAHASR